MLFIFEVIAVLSVVVVAWLLPSGRRSYFRGAARQLRRLAARRWTAVLLVGLTSFLLNAGITFFWRLPQPNANDEFCYLLTADTFAQGRLTNPTHPLWTAFEVPSVIQHPTCQSKYPPGQGIALALGQVLGGHPIVGVWLSMALACAALCWMLQAWMPPRWALLGAVLAVVSAHMVVWWGQSYWGGAVAMTGGALLFGGLRRIVRRPDVIHALLLGLGVVILANSRPYEGLVASLPAAVVLLGWIVRRRRAPAGAILGRVVVPIAAVVAAGALWMGYYNFRVTGVWWRMPYQIWQDNASHGPDLTATLLVWNHPSVLLLRELKWAVWKLYRQELFYIRCVLLVPFLAGIWGWRGRWNTFAILTCALVMGAVTLELAYALPHYTAPVACLILFVVVQGVRRLRVSRALGGLRGQFVVAAVPVLTLVTLIVRLPTERRWYPIDEWYLCRAHILADLESTPGKHLVIVRYGPAHGADVTWTYNRADIDSAKVVWASQLPPEQHEQLLQYFNDRRVWLVEADAEAPRLRLYPEDRAAAPQDP